MKHNVPGLNYLQVFKKHRGIMLFEAILFILLGCFAIAAPTLFTVATDYLLGGFFIVGGSMQLYRTYKMWGISGSWLSFFGSLITIFAGCTLLTRPLVGILALTTILAVYFLIASAVKMSLAFSYQQTHKFWLVVNSLLSLALGLMIIAGLPETATWVIGLFVGIDFLFFGFMLLAFYSSVDE
ncbi:MAG: hypothetical protein JWO53_28 [Chlamydiia bacterium]|nr:hypothetical protein [Chlamydiia bacterium]